MRHCNIIIADKLEAETLPQIFIFISDSASPPGQCLSQKHKYYRYMYMHAYKYMCGR